MKTKIDPGDDELVFVGFLRVEEDELQVSESGVRRRVSTFSEGESEGGEGEGVEARYLLISYVAKGVLGVRRGAFSVFCGCGEVC